MQWTRGFRVMVPLAGISIFLSACGSSSSSTPATGGPTSSPAPATSVSNAGSPTQAPVPTEKPVPAESNPPGDIPDTTAFVPYVSAAGKIAIKVPEGWARRTTKSSVTFTSTLNSVAVSWTPASSASTPASAKKIDVPNLQSSARAFTLQSINSVTLPGGPAVLITFQENSAPNSVTGKQYRLVVERFEFFRNGKEGILSLSSPVGADNVDPWRIVSESFRWA